jgi:hypothetical protein
MEVRPFNPQLMSEKALKDISVGDNKPPKSLIQKKDNK